MTTPETETPKPGPGAYDGPGAPECFDGPGGPCCYDPDGADAEEREPEGEVA